MRQIVLVGAFVILWFLSLQIVLPIRLGGPDAELSHGLRFKFLLATGIGTALWAIFYGLVLLRVIVL
ncbi:MAG TPA: hypothetical protein VIJ62_15500 [Rhizomicrobium sp.]|jgi:hypothetical protein